MVVKSSIRNRLTLVSHVHVFSSVVFFTLVLQVEGSKFPHFDTAVLRILRAAHHHLRRGALARTRACLSLWVYLCAHRLSQVRVHKGLPVSALSDGANWCLWLSHSACPL